MTHDNPIPFPLLDIDDEENYGFEEDLPEKDVEEKEEDEKDEEKEDDYSDYNYEE